MELECVATNDTIFLNAYGFNTIGDDSIAAGEIGSPDAIDENGLSSIEFNVYPNPSVDVLNIETQNFQGTSRYSIVNTSGQLIREGSLEPSINVSDLAAGLYVIQVADAYAIGQKVFVVK